MTQHQLTDLMQQHHYAEAADRMRLIAHITQDCVMQHNVCKVHTDIREHVENVLQHLTVAVQLAEQHAAQIKD